MINKLRFGDAGAKNYAKAFLKFFKLTYKKQLLKNRRKI